VHLAGVDLAGPVLVHELEDFAELCELHVGQVEAAHLDGAGGGGFRVQDVVIGV